MKTVLILMIFLTCKVALAKAPGASTKPHSTLSTDVKFDGHLVGGKGQAPMEALADVENEKSIDDLIGVRKNFSDRSTRAKGMR